jgi:LEA14-like dessication related protein
MKIKLSFIAAILICGFLYTTCDLFKDMVKEPEVTLDSVEFSEINYTGLTLLSNVKVKNNMSVDIPFPNIDIDIHVFDIDASLFKGSIESGGILKSNGFTTVQVFSPFTYVELINLITGLADENKRENPVYKLNMTVHIPVEGYGEFSFPFSREGNIPQMRVPDITFASTPKAALTYGSIPGVPNGGKIEFSLNVKNNSNIAVLVKDLSYSLKIGNTSFNGGATEKPNLNSKETGILTFSFPITVENIATIGLTALTGGSFNYELTGNYMFGLDFPLIKELGDSFTLKK